MFNPPSIAIRPKRDRLPPWSPLPLASSYAATEQAPQKKDYRFNPIAFCREVLHWHPWASGDPANPGQVEILELYALALRQLHERQAFELGQLTLDQLQHWTPGQVIRSWLRMESGHGFGKTALMAAIVLHMMACFPPTIGYTFAPSEAQLNMLIWKDIRQMHANAGLEGKVLPSRAQLKISPNHFVVGRAVAAGKDTGQLQGQHGPFKIIVVDEATDVGEVVFNSLEPLTSSGICIVLLAANPANRVCRFHRLATVAKVANVRGSCLQHPNVVQGRDVIAGAVTRAWVDDKIDRWTEILPAHDPKRYTFEPPWRPGEIRAPLQTMDGDEFLFRVMGIPPGRSHSSAIVSPAQFDAARTRTPAAGVTAWATIGVDCSRFGVDKAVAASRHGNHVRFFARLDHDNRDGAPTYEMLEVIVSEARRLKAAGCSSLHIRVDAGYGGGLVDALRSSLDLRFLVKAVVSEVHFGGRSMTDPTLADRATELYVIGSRELDSVRLVDPPDRLEEDLTDRSYEMVQVKRGTGYRSLRKLADKGAYNAKHGHSPDDGDAWALCILPPELFGDTGAATDTFAISDPSPWRGGGRKARDEWE